ncbi:DUF4253 domain-containing protein [Flavivirga abyssicola]|uniref:DUF4253 domain-containing protein n=1 Tax=Flavivirga abyssicola TaxID=3063533 RepID=UPI0026E0AB66|nr:DUF4253 domain-containing protein [Flavivirga sp. MEBiC07777]WVK14647.1 DUF4253 domain-containing protein [Flavivirga sp. MEBiC07777]
MIRKINYLLLLMTIISCGQNSVNYSESELKLFNNIGFDKTVLSELKQKTNKEFTQLEISDPGYLIGENGDEQKIGVEKINGISFRVSENESYEIVLTYKDKLKEQGYLLFISESGYKSPSTISVIKSTDKFDILSVQKTDGINFEIENKDVIEKLKDWDKIYGIEILGADYDWVELIFEKDIKNVSLFAKEVYEFCPDAVDQGVGEIKELERIIREEKRLFLWWD